MPLGQVGAWPAAGQIELDTHMVQRIDSYRYYHDEYAQLKAEITRDVMEQLLDRFYDIPTWVQHSGGSVSSRGENLSQMTVRDLLELRWRVLWRHRLDPGARIEYRLEWIDRWIQDELRHDAANDAAAMSGIRWGVDEPNHDHALNVPAVTKPSGSFEYRRRTGTA